MPTPISSGNRSHSPRPMEPRAVQSSSIERSNNINLENANRISRNLKNVTSYQGGIVIKSNDSERPWNITGDIRAHKSIVLENVIHTGEIIESLSGNISMKQCKAGSKIQASGDIILDQVIQIRTGTVESTHDSVEIINSQVGQINASKNIKIQTLYTTPEHKTTVRKLGNNQVHPRDHAAGVDTFDQASRSADRRNGEVNGTDIGRPEQGKIPVAAVIRNVEVVGNDFYMTEDTLILGQHVTKENAFGLIVKADSNRDVNLMGKNFYLNGELICSPNYLQTFSAASN
ncbi:hypothetical protein [Serratia sp. M24T3]|uniref:hypothetical protein n=1 Tax=Serratia sp. M24T3 TaxID=932213 RepID=UPI00025BC356|nr:hypothetical protein [Serratia sp. M24T3]EIC85831.1 hypothetical protein SPM24T3_05811 [Serratia sp. M24T3]